MHILQHISRLLTKHFQIFMMEQTSVILFLVGGLVMAYYFMSTPEPKIEVPLKDSYDYIIVGAGSAGSVLASRLSEDKENSVLLVEAGPEETDSPLVKVPIKWFSLQRTYLDWGFKTVPQKYSSFGLKNKESAWTRGRMLGGCSSHNAMVYIRGSRHDYDEWAEQGCKGWSFKDVLPYFLKNEHITLDQLKNSAYHSTGGSWSVKTHEVTPMADIYMKAGEQMGYKLTDCNGVNQLGFCKTPANTKNGQRISTAIAYLRPAMDRPNLHVSVNSLASKVLIKNKKATGIELIKNTRKVTVKANKEVILSGGAINSPQLLMLSGVGPAAHLKELGIPVHADLPVGDNLQDHLMLVNEHSINVSYSVTPEKIKSFWTNFQFDWLGTGIKTSSLIEGSAFFDTNKDTKYSDIQFHMYSAIPSDELVKQNFYYDEETRDKMKAFHGDNKYGFAVLVILLRPLSKGTLRLKSTDPLDHPLIDANYLSNNEDMKTYLQGVRLYEQFMDTKAIREIGASRENNAFLPFCTEHKRWSDSFWECIIRKYALTIYHPTTTCRMGPDNDPTAVG
ncbi:hypothetical protein KUTeg_019165 [Tegillarca granosa]|uniref:Glucose-methanol-choline oxidoreductase N-terminal domain-containing protein n=1 Tax=Tegillarca granosa TaxID=220873 RepID=A0ABQ9EBQ3_TEGGR|nr:hypothetical protein KUTeg_019165 [Tegillarca granosa]